MKSHQNQTTEIPRNTNAIGDDAYLVEIADRLQRLRSLTGAKESAAASPSFN